MPHTPGPWLDTPPMNPHGTAHRVIAGSPQGLPHIAYVPRNSYAAVESEALANARLIAAAPELLACCKALKDIWPLSGYELEAFCDATLMPMIRAALAKAGGR